jgi:hypothetical protein
VTVKQPYNNVANHVGVDIHSVVQASPVPTSKARTAQYQVWLTQQVIVFHNHKHQATHLQTVLPVTNLIHTL